MMGFYKPFGKGKNGKIPSLFLKYRVIKPKEQAVSYENEIRILCDLFNIEEYLKRPNIYERHRNLLLPLNSFFINNKDELNTPISKNERAYQIWNDEKILDSSLCKNIIKWNRLEEKLNYYLTPEPFFDYIHTKKEKMNILVVENKDTWYTLRKIMNNLKEECYLCDIEIDGLVYGEGNKITKLNALEEYETQVIQRKCNFFYWGDLDYAGIEMFKRVVSQNNESSINLFSRIYEMMIDTKDLGMLGKIKHKQNSHILLDIFLESFTTDYQEKIKSILNNNCYIPQEIINAAILKEIFKEKGSL